MYRYTEEWLRDLEKRKEEADPGPESNLAKKIRRYCKEQGWPAFVVPQHPAIRKILPPAWLDAVIALPGRRVLWLELKSATGKLKAHQKLMAQMLLTLGHEWHKVKTFKKFKEIVYEKKI